MPCRCWALSRQEAWWKDVEILMLRHRLAIARTSDRELIGSFMGSSSRPRRARGARHDDGAVDSAADPQDAGCPCIAPGHPWVGGVPGVAGAGVTAPDFFAADLLDGAKVCILAVIEHGSRRVRFLGITGIFP